MNSVVHDTIQFTEHIAAPVARVWQALADAAERAVWSAPAGERMEYHADDFREGGVDRYRCGPPETMEFHAEVGYTKIVPSLFIGYTETVTAGQPLATALVTWQLAPTGAGTDITLTSQVVSYVGQGMVDGQRNGHRIALTQLAQRLS